jgi:uncharacterized repeat protein (TIGR03803 family)
MQNPKLWSTLVAALLCFAAMLFAHAGAPYALAQDTVLYSFNNTTGNVPFVGVTLDKNGNVYGTTAVGGNLSICLNNGCGVAYEIVHNSDGTWTNRTLYTFVGGPSDGAFPDGTLTFDSRGHIFGTTYYGGNGPCDQGEFSGCGTVFELVHNPTGGWSESVIYHFQGGTDGAWPASNVILDAQGNLYGTTSFGGISTPCVTFTAPTGCGTVFELSPNGSGGWTESVLYSFKGGMDGVNPYAGVTFNGAGTLFGTTGGGGFSCGQYLQGSECGTVFKLRQTPTGWVKSTPYRFKGGTDGFEPDGSLVVDASGNLFGATYFGGLSSIVFGNGTVFELTPNGSGGWTESVLYRFTGLLDGGYPSAGVVLDAAGNVYGIAFAGGTSGQDAGGGTAFKLTPTSTGWSETTLASFQTQNGGELSYGGATLDSSGNLYGTMTHGGTSTYPCPDGCGVVFEVPAQ